MKRVLRYLGRELNGIAPPLAAFLAVWAGMVFLGWWLGVEA